MERESGYGEVYKGTRPPQATPAPGLLHFSIFYARASVSRLLARLPRKGLLNARDAGLVYDWGQQLGLTRPRA